MYEPVTSVDDWRRPETCFLSFCLPACLSVWLFGCLYLPVSVSASDSLSRAHLECLPASTPPKHPCSGRSLESRRTLQPHTPIWDAKQPNSVVAFTQHAAQGSTHENKRHRRCTIQAASNRTVSLWVNHERIGRDNTKDQPQSQLWRCSVGL